MKTCVLSLFPPLAAFLLLPLQAELRTFTNNEGRTVEAEIIQASKTTAKLRIKGGRIANVNIQTLSEGDQTFIATWIADRLPDIEVSPDFGRSITKNRTEYARASTTQKFNCSVSLKNFSPNKSLEPTEVVYYLVGKSVSDETFKIISRQVIEITALDPGKTKVVQFEDVTNTYNDTLKVSDGEDPTTLGYKILGYLLHIQRKRDKRELYLNSPTIFLENAKDEISALQKDDITDDTFIKAPVVEMPEPEPEKTEEPEVITIK